MEPTFPGIRRRTIKVNSFEELLHCGMPHAASLLKDPPAHRCVHQLVPALHLLVDTQLTQHEPNPFPVQLPVKLLQAFACDFAKVQQITAGLDARSLATANPRRFYLSITPRVVLGG
jgi:hypothetical protein